MKKYMIALKNGKVLENLKLNGSMYVSKTEITEKDLPVAGLAKVTITETDEEGNATVSVITDAVCDTILHWPEGWLFNIREKTENEKRAERIAFMEGCIMEMSEEVYK